MRRLLLLLSALLLCLPVFAQDRDLDNYKPLTSTGPIPPDFLKFYITSNEFDSSRVTGEAGEKFRQQNAALLAGLFASGKVLFNDPLSRYAQKVLDTLLSRDKALKGKLRVYTLRSAEANAFTSHDGKIFITTGFIANLENEAQLAYVLAHESVHYRNNHLYRDFMQRENAAQGSLEGLRYSREHEGEADIEGLRILLGSDYSTENIDWVLDVLFYSYLPVDNVPLDKDFFRTGDLSIPDSCYLQDTAMAEIGHEDDNYYDAFQTHPSITNRKKEIKSFLEFQKKDTLRKQFLFPESEFYHVRNIARFELSYIYYIDLKLEGSVYNSYVMLQEFPKNEYLQKMLAGALYALCTFKKDSIAFAKVHTPYKKLEGYQKQFSYLYEKMNWRQLCGLAKAYTMKIAGDSLDAELRELMDAIEYTSIGFSASGPVQPPSGASQKLVVIPDITYLDKHGENILRISGDIYSSLKEQVIALGEEKKKEAFALDPFTLLNSDIRAYNDLVLLNDWVSNRLKDEQHHTFIRMNDIEKMKEKYGREISFVSITVHENSFFKSLFGKKYSISYLAMSFDLATSRLTHTGSSYANTKTPFVEKKKLEDVLFKKE
jgi:Zn-dependent protease with chaperone function